MFTRIVHSLFIISFLSSLALGGSTGKISGVVKDKKTGDPIIGANVRLEGTTLGSMTDFDGKYFMINVPPNDYSMVVTMVGYTPSKTTGVRVKGDLTTTIDVEITETVLQIGEAVEVVAERPLVQKDLTAKTAIVSGNDIAAMPVSEVGAVVNMQAGFVSGSLRGGRSGEVAYWIDGVPVTDAFNGSQIVEVNKSLVQELQVISGAFNAEYGQAMSGIVNITSKEGGSKFSGGLGIYGGDYALTNDSIFPGNSFKANNIRNIEGNLSGPLLTDDLTFFTNARYIYFNGWEKGYRRFNPWNIPKLTNDQLESVFSDGKGDSSIVPMNWSERYYAQAKLTWHISSLMKFSVDYIYDDTKKKGLDAFGNYRRDYFYNPDGVGNQYNLSNTIIFQFNHSLSSSTFYTIGGSIFKKDYKYYLYDLQYQDSTLSNGDHVQNEVVDPYGPHYVDPNLSVAPAYSFMVGGTDPNKDHRSTQTALIKFDLTSQMDEMNMVKFGVEYRSHDITNEHIELKSASSQTGFDPAILRPYIRTMILDINSPYHDYYEHHPKEFSAYLQDKMEYKNVIVNVGVRFDYFQPDGLVLNDAHPDTSDPLHYMYTVNDPSIDSPVRSDHLDVSQQGGSTTLQQREQYWYKSATSKYAVSPRLGVSFPITDRGIVHFSYGHFFQLPGFERLYENPRFKISQNSSGIIGIMGNTDLKPEQTVSAELGVQQQLSEDVAFDATIYMRDIRGLTQTAIFDVSGGGQYAQYANSDFGTVKGIVLTVDKKFSGGITARVDYTYQVADGTASDPQQAKNRIAGGGLPDIQMVPLDWDQRHTLNVSLNYTMTSWGVSSILQYGSGSPYTPDLSNPSTGTTIVTNSQIKPSTFNCDLRAYYELNLNPLKLIFFTRIFNVFDTRNQKGVYASTGRADYDWINEMQARSVKLYVNTVDQWFTDGTKYSEPRRFEFGMNLEF
ncbi:MAG: TonB-dependent receptor [Ignavibacteriales bacterium]|nr:TonB-dependent receptor [Ignavibacteriales bacterium]